MGVKSMDNYLEILNGYVCDEDKVVTYKWLSKELEVHVNIAKQILWEFWQNYKKDDDITSTVMLIGYLKSGGMRVEVVKQSNLNTAKDKFNKIISEHLYSVQKSIPDLEFHFINDEGDVRFSAIKCNESVERSDEELSNLRWGSLFKDRPVPKKTNVKSPDNKPEKVKPSETVKHNNQTNRKSTDKKTVPVSQKTGFNNLFGKVTNKENNNKPSTSNDIKNNQEITPEKTSSNDKSNSSLKENKFVKKDDKKGISSYFGKNANVTKDSPKEEETKKEQTKEKPNVKDNVKDNNEIKVISTKINDKTEKEKRGTKRNRSKESNKNTMKKRKRIIVEDDSSDSESEDEIMESDSEPESTEIIDIKKSPSPPTPPRVMNSNGKARILKVVDRTYEEDGFLVTKKVHVYEDCPEDTTEIKEKEESIQHQKDVAKVQTKKKQTTLTSFFKRS
ncbi:PREDICTED: DNA polymerase delta subunit 3-like [Polistes dominula]|uniref:DNA polymerase delta subunit 3 n=1 Tax=Polistes dominula TaxID=743375 RepID=A0ABM1IFJ0_POLDO|nr:PREDICTED: DNA polymerase delta subunit 3-like [Polistes dominula]